MTSQSPHGSTFALSELSLRARLTYAAHLFKAVAKQHHTALIPLLRPFVPRDGVVFDIGSHAGQFTKLFARLVPQGRVWSFEPSPYALSILNRAVRLNRLSNVAIRACALGEREGELFLATPLKDGGSYRFGLAHFGEERRNARRERVLVTTIDRVVEEERIERIDFLKADIEGWELRMLEGGKAAIARFEPALLLEVNDKALARAGDSVGALWDFLTRRGYRPWRLGDPEPLPPDAPPVEGDILWLPRRYAAA